MTTMTQQDYFSLKALLKANNITFKGADLLERVNSNWMTKEFPTWFKYVDSDDMKVVAFMRLSQQKGCELSLGGDIADSIVNQMIEANQ